MRPIESPTLLITADDYGYSPSYDRGIVAAARRGAVDAVSVMALRDPDPGPLLEAEVRIGLHLEPLDVAPLALQWEGFEAAFGRPPGHIDGHKHCHAAAGGPALAVAKLARRCGVYVRSVDGRHRRLLRCQGVATCDRLVGRLGEDEPAVPAEVEAWLAGEPPAGITEWMVHPGRAGGGSSYDRGREEDLELVLELAGRPPWRG
jgi:predicted glycoside hydrolase/deacetylase ChbG (UPF0249 family)